jgi:hypothetical protein
VFQIFLNFIFFFSISFLVWSNPAKDARHATRISIKFSYVFTSVYIVFKILETDNRYHNFRNPCLVHGQNLFLKHQNLFVYIQVKNYLISYFNTSLIQSSS